MMFQHFTTIMYSKKANITILPYHDHDTASKLLHSLDCTVWSAKVESIMESPNYETLCVYELFSKLKSSKVDWKLNAKSTSPTDSNSLALVSGLGYGHANSSTKHFTLSSLVSIPDEQFQVLRKEHLALLTKWFGHLYDNRKGSRRVSRRATDAGSWETSYLSGWNQR
jgi:hypothetical protein